MGDELKRYRWYYNGMLPDSSGGLCKYEDAAAAIEQLQAQLAQAKRALERAGYTLKEGAQEWKPPLGPSASPLLDRIDLLQQQLAQARYQLTLKNEALDAVVDACKQSRTSTRRLRFIQQRAQWALDCKQFLRSAFNIPKRAEQTNETLFIDNRRLREELQQAREQAVRDDESLGQVMDERDRAEDALLESSMALGGGEWCVKLPSEDPPDSGNLCLDVPELCRQLVADNQQLRTELQQAREQVERLTSDVSAQKKTTEIHAYQAAQYYAELEQLRARLEACTCQER